MVLGGVATLVLLIVVVMLLWRTGGAKAVSDNAALIGALVALGGVFTAQMVSIALDDRRTLESNIIEERRTQEARGLEAQRAHEAALQKYLENVGNLLIEQPLQRASPGDPLSTLVRVQTLSVLENLDPDRKRILLRFLDESGLIYRQKPVVSLAQATLSNANLRGGDLVGDDLRLVYLNGANLSFASLFIADLGGANLIGARLDGTNLGNANLIEANLSGANLSQAKGITKEEIEQQADFLEGATMPDGQKYEDWLKDKERRKENGKNE